MNFVREWIERHLADPQVVGLALLLAGGLVIVMWLGDMLAPVIAGAIIAYLLEAPVRYLQRHRSPRSVAVAFVFVVFMALMLAIFFGLLPLLSHQLAALIQQFPVMLGKGQEALLALPEQYPELFSEAQVVELISAIRAEVVSIGQKALSVSLASVVDVLTILVYLILLPLVVFFFLKDKDRILGWLADFLPERRGLAVKVWHDTDVQIGNYVRGKVIQILIVWAVTLVTFTLLGLNFVMLLSVLVGLSVLIPYIGPTTVTVPIAFIAYFQFGFTAELGWVMVAYLVIQFMDGNFLVPLLFSEVVDLHPVAIIVAILIFGGFWGFWGVFFAIPLATLVQAVIKAWPTHPDLRHPSDRDVSGVETPEDPD